MPKQKNGRKSPKKSASGKNKVSRISRIPLWQKIPFVSLHAVLAGLFVVGIIMAIGLLTEKPPAPEGVIKDPKATARLHQLSIKASEFEAEQLTVGASIIDSKKLDQELASIQSEIDSGRHRKAVEAMDSLEEELEEAKKELDEVRHNKLAAKIADPANQNTAFEIPILMYHHPPDDFEQQMQSIIDKGYTAIALDELSKAFAGEALPQKPLIITFDDGFADQMKVVPFLTANSLKATFYIITGGDKSDYCIGANRDNEKSCGDEYLTWNQIKQLDSNSLFTIGAHTVDHLNLASKSDEDQAFQIIEGKKIIEAQLGHKIYHFCYPYGSFNEDSIEEVKKAGFLTATTTIPGTIQNASSIYTLRRIRTTYDLP